MGYGKTTFINNLTILSHIKNFIDGDELLLDNNIPNKNIYWYSDDFINEQQKIIECFKKTLNKNHNILYSGNPTIIKLLYPKTFVVYDGDVNKRWARLQKRKLNGGYCPGLKHFNIEELSYKTIKPLYENLTQLINRNYVAISGLARAGKDTIG
ncbi:MAG: hypothetical protein KGD67_12940, partial [Candidatus Lokiarchaeota archaeon]|nr:hypothetical protein [Candidatus Lokiarchaeota archaeon]